MMIHDYENKVMPTFLFFSIIIVNIINQDEGYLLKDDISRPMKNGVESVLQKYLRSIKRLSADFPNHNVEFQLEIIGSVTQPPEVPQRRIFRIHKQPVMRRSGDETNTINNESITKIARTTAVHTTTTTPILPPSKAMWTTLDPQNKPIYREDLQRALDEFEKKISITQTTKDCQVVHSIQTVPFPAFITPHSSTHNKINRMNLKNILELLKRGVHVETHVNKPNDDNLDWLQIKIPQNI